MSIKSRLKRIEGKLPDESKVAEFYTKEALLFWDYESYRNLNVEFVFALYMNDFEKAAALEKELLKALETLEPITKPSKIDSGAYDKLQQSEVARYMDENPETITFNDETIRHEIGEKWEFYDGD